MQQRKGIEGQMVVYMAGPAELTTLILLFI